jgi:hypothetical protein
MSSLLERIARRRRATASSRLGPRSQPVNGWALPPSANGAPPTATERPPEPEPEPQLDREPEPQLEPPADTEPDVPVSTIWVEDEDVWIEPPTPEAEPEPPTPEAEPEPPATPEYAAGPEPLRPARPGAAHLGLAERGQMRRRARYLRRLREVQLRDLGGFVLELHRFGRERPELVEAKLRAAAGTDEELRALETALDGHASLRELREAGIGGACADCGAVFGSADHFCAACGAPLGTDPCHDREPLDEPRRWAPPWPSPARSASRMTTGARTAAPSWRATRSGASSAARRGR